MTIKVVLLDLDDTLLLYPEGGHSSFVRRYIALLAETLNARGFDGSAILGQIISGVRTLGSKTDPRQTNSDIYWNAIGTDRDGLQEAFAHFYADVYPQLGSTSKPHPSARGLVDELQARGYDVVIATNPVYAQTATLQRVEWLGLDPGQVGRVTHAENSHFAKPMPHYYEEILFHAGYEPSEAVMVGDNWDSRHRGCCTRLVCEPSGSAPDADSRPSMAVIADGFGTLDALRGMCAASGSWLAKPRTEREVDPRPDYRRVCWGQRARFRASRMAFSAHKWPQRPDPRRMVAAGSGRSSGRCRGRRAAPPPANHPARGQPLPAACRTPHPAPGTRRIFSWRGWRGERARDFADRAPERRSNSSQSLGADDWPRPARHSTYGPTSLFEMALFTTRHDLLHITQLIRNDSALQVRSSNEWIYL